MTRRGHHNNSSSSNNSHRNPEPSTLLSFRESLLSLDAASHKSRDFQNPRRSEEGYQDSEADSDLYKDEDIGAPGSNSFGQKILSLVPPRPEDIIGNRVSYFLEITFFYFVLLFFFYNHFGVTYQSVQEYKEMLSELSYAA